MKRVLLALILLPLCLAESAQATGYVYRNGYYWYGQDAYTKSQRYQPGYTYYHCGYRYYTPGYYYNYYLYSHSTPAVVTQQVTVNTPDWRSRLLDIAAARDRAEIRQRAAAFEQVYFNETVKTLGLEGNFRLQNYGISPPYPVSPYAAAAPLQLSSAGPQASSLYGYTSNTIASFYGDTSPAQLFQQAARLTENTQTLSADALKRFNELITTDSAARARIAEILARAQAAQEFLRALQGSGGTITVQGTAYKITQGKEGRLDLVPQVSPMADPVDGKLDPEAAKQAWIKSAAGRCYGCHGRAGPDGKPRLEGKFDVQTFPGLSKADRQRLIQERLLTTDLSRRMPRGEDGKATPDPLPPAEIAAWQSLP